MDRRSPKQQKHLLKRLQRKRRVQDHQKKQWFVVLLVTAVAVLGWLAFEAKRSPGGASRKKSIVGDAKSPGDKDKPIAGTTDVPPTRGSSVPVPPERQPNPPRNALDTDKRYSGKTLSLYQHRPGQPQTFPERSGQPTQVQKRTEHDRSTTAKGLQLHDGKRQAANEATKTVINKAKIASRNSGAGQKPSKSFVYLASKLHEPNLDVRQETVRKLGQLQTAAAFTVLVQELPRMGTLVREQCMMTLATWQGELRNQAMDAIIEHLRLDKARTVRRIAAEHLGKMAGGDYRTSDSPARVRVKKAAIMLEQSLRRDKSTSVRQHAIRGIAAIGDRNGIKAIARYGLADDYQSVRREAVLAFSTLNAVDNVDILIRHFFREKYLYVREPLIDIVYRLHKDKAFAFLCRVLSFRRNQNAIRRKSAEFLGTYADKQDYHRPASKCLAQSFVNEKDQSLRLVILKSITRYDRRLQAVQFVIQQALKDNRKIRTAAQEILMAQK